MMRSISIIQSKIRRTRSSYKPSTIPYQNMYPHENYGYIFTSLTFRHKKVAHQVARTLLWLHLRHRTAEAVCGICLVITSYYPLPHLALRRVPSSPVLGPWPPVPRSLVGFWHHSFYCFIDRFLKKTSPVTPRTKRLT